MKETLVLNQKCASYFFCNQGNSSVIHLFASKSLVFTHHYTFSGTSVHGGCRIQLGWL